MAEKALKSPLEQLRQLADSERGRIQISGISESRAAAVAAWLIREERDKALVLSPSPERAKRLAADLSFFADRPVYCLPEEENGLLRFDAKSHETLEARFRALAAFCGEEPCVLVAGGSALLRRLPPRAVFSGAAFSLRAGESVDPEALKRRLTELGYERMPSVSARGQYSVRGGIIDIFPLNEEEPSRLELFDTEIDSLRRFDPLTQRSLGARGALKVYPASFFIGGEDAFRSAAQRIGAAYDKALRGIDGERAENLRERRGRLLDALETRSNLQLLEPLLPCFYESCAFLWDYLAQDGMLFFEDPDRLQENLKLWESEQEEDFRILLERGMALPQEWEQLGSRKDLDAARKRRRVFLMTPFQKLDRAAAAPDASFSIVSREPPAFQGRMDFLAAELARYQKLQYRIRLLCSSPQREQSLREFLEQNGLAEAASVEHGELSVGCDFPEERLLILCEKDVFHSAKKSRRRRQTEGAPIRAFTDIRQGDYVVHEHHGIGRFLGVEQMLVQGVRNDYLKIQYAGQDMLYVPVEQMDLVRRYIGEGESAPRISKLSGGEWKKTKLKAKAAILDMARELLEISAARQLEPGYAFGPDTPWQAEFEEQFPYRETDDQLRCVEEIKRDMERPVPMDRLLCGDVGYGKTEVAARAVFKCLAEGKQAAVLVPTTLLANQHFYTFQSRLASFPFRVEMLSRFRSEGEQRKILKELADGRIDLIIGTHRLLSQDVRFKDLGLLVVDEEQRFGVKHKESIKQLRRNVDVLTLSATPIPRTLHMSLVGIRSMSLLEEPPEDRYPVQTYVMEQDDELLRQAIARELDRDGQVYVVCNRVQGIERLAARLRLLLPEAEIAVGHGQMSEERLEDVTMDFIEHRSNVLLATTIIENGIDIPNANTIIVLNADRFGLSQLYQLRGRVGRSNRLAYAYLLYQKDRSLSEAAEKRLRAIKEFTEFGAGFRIAMRDLEIRGAGDLLGSQQHGHMLAVGYDLYCKMLEETAAQLAGKSRQEEAPEASVELAAEAYLPDDYIPDEMQKLEMYQRIAAIRDRGDREECIDELIDRFGDPPRPAHTLVEISYLRALAQALGICRVHREQEKLVFTFASKEAAEPRKLAALSQRFQSRLLLYGGARPCMRYLPEKRDALAEAIRLLEAYREA